MKNNSIQFSRWVAALPRHTARKGMAASIVRAREDERNRIGHELHDNVNQILTCAHLYLSVLKRECLEFNDLIGKTMEIVQSGIDEIRKLSKEMVADDLKKDGLIEHTRRLVEELEGAGVFNISFEHSQPSCVERLDHCKKLTIYRIIQEQVKNIITYSHARNIRIFLFCNDDQVRLQITDDGVGFDFPNAKKGLGLSNIYKRVNLYKGKVLVDTARGKGCSLIVNIPVLPVLNNC